MLKTIDLIEGIDEKYVPMLKQVNIPDFTKCIATICWISMDTVNDKMIKEYLVQWAKSKYVFYKMLGNKIKLDCPFSYTRFANETEDRFLEVMKDFPAYYPWLEACMPLTTNKMVSHELGWEFGKWMANAFPNFRWEGSLLTRFFKHYLQAPDELVTKIGQIFENNKIEATYTLSIDPVDMMLASETPYDWNSCYKLDPSDSEGHFDGCLAAILDTSSLITYVWNREGEYQLKESGLKFKKIRYKQMRAWLSIAPENNAFYLNRIYPAKQKYGDSFEKELRIIIEKVITDYTKATNKWVPIYSSQCQRKFAYGYEEFDCEDRTYIQQDVSSANPPHWYVYDVKIECPCGCKTEMPGFYSGGNPVEYDDTVEYAGEGYSCEGIRETRHYCEYCDDYCDDDPEYSDCCCECSYWQDAHPTCSLDRDVECLFYNEGYNDELEARRDLDGSYVQACGDCDSCSRCRIWKEEGPQEEEDGTELSEGAEEEE